MSKDLNIRICEVHAQYTALYEAVCTMEHHYHEHARDAVLRTLRTMRDKAYFEYDNLMSMLRVLGG